MPVHRAQGWASETPPLLGWGEHGQPFPVPGLGEGARYESSARVRPGLFGKVTGHTVRRVWRVEDVDLTVTLERDDDESIARPLPDGEALLATGRVSTD